MKATPEKETNTIRTIKMITCDHAMNTTDNAAHFNAVKNTHKYTTTTFARGLFLYFVKKYFFWINA